MSLFIEKLYCTRFASKQRASLDHFFYTFHRRSCSLIAFTFFFFCLRNKAMNLYEVSVYLVKIFQFSNSATVDDHWAKKQEKQRCFQLIPRKPLKRGLPQLIDNDLLPLDPLLPLFHSQSLEFQDRSQLLQYTLFNLPHRSHRLTMMRQEG